MMRHRNGFDKGIVVLFSLVTLIFLALVGGFIAGANAYETTQTQDRSQGEFSIDGQQEVTLVTGETIFVQEKNGKIHAEVKDAEGQYQTVKENGSFYLYPSEYDPQFFDRELFNITRLVQNESYQKDGPSVLFEYGDGFQAKSLDETESVNINNDYDIISASSATLSGGIDKETLRSNGVDKVWLDRKLNVQLDESTSEINAIAARNNFNVSGDGVEVAVIDTGVDSDHPDLDDSVVFEENFVSDESTTEDKANHGTPVAGIISGDGTESNGDYVGVAPDSEIYNMRALGSDGSGELSDIISAVDESVNQEVDIISMSLGGDIDPDNPLNDAVNQASSQGIVVITSAGNSGSDYRTISAPANAKKAIAVGADDTLNRQTSSDIPSFSSRGPVQDGFRVKPAITAPGVKITSTGSGDLSGSQYPYGDREFSGTSFAAPHVSGVVALMLENNPDLTVSEVRSNLVTTADDLDEDVYSQGTGQVNASEALDTEVSVSDPQIGFNFNRFEDFGAEKTRTFEITNKNDRDMSLNLSGSLRHVKERTKGTFDITPNSIELSSGETKQIEVSITADSQRHGLYSGSIIVEDNGNNNIATLSFGYNQPFEGDEYIKIKKETRDGRSAQDSSVRVRSINGGQYELLWFDKDNTAYFVPETEGPFVVATNGFFSNLESSVIMVDVLSDTSQDEFILDETKAKEYKFDVSDLEEKRGNILYRVSESSISYEDFAGNYFSIGILDIGIEEDKTTYLYGFDESDSLPETEYMYREIAVPEDTHEEHETGGIQNEYVYDMLTYTNGYNGSVTDDVRQNEMRKLDNMYLRDDEDVLLGDKTPPSIFNVAHTFKPNTELGWGSPIISTLFNELGTQYDQNYYHTATGTASRFGIKIDYGGTKYKEIGDYRINLPVVKDPNPDTLDLTFNNRPFVPNVDTSITSEGLQQEGQFFSTELNDDIRRNVMFRGWKELSNSYSVKINGNRVAYDDSVESTYEFVDNTDLNEGDVVEINVTGGEITFNQHKTEYKVEYDPDGINEPPEIESITPKNIDKNNTVTFNEHKPVEILVELDSHTKNGIDEIDASYAIEDPFTTRAKTTSNDWKEVDEIEQIEEELYKIKFTPDRTSAEVISLNLTASDNEGSTVNMELQNTLRVKWQDFVSGKIVGKYGDPINNIEILISEDDSTIGSIKTDSNGKFSLTISNSDSTQTFRASTDSDRVKSLSKELIIGESVVMQTERLYPPKLPRFENKPNDLNGDGLYRDVNGDQEFDIFDVQNFFDGLSTNVVQNNSLFFNFSGVQEERATIFDVQALYTDLISGN